jgi:hypothetical protein
MPFQRGAAGWGTDADSDVSIQVDNPLKWPGGVFFGPGNGWSATFSVGGFFRRQRTAFVAKARAEWAPPPEDTLPGIDPDDAIVPGDTTGKDQGDIA